MSGLLRPRAGAILFDGEEIGGLSPRACSTLGIVHVPQDRSLFPLMTVWDNLLMGGYSLRDRKLVRRRAEQLAERFPLVARAAQRTRRARSRAASRSSSRSRGR